VELSTTSEILFAAKMKELIVSIFAQYLLFRQSRRSSTQKHQLLMVMGKEPRYRNGEGSSWCKNLGI
jgi:hypothetical protein